MLMWLGVKVCFPRWSTAVQARRLQGTFVDSGMVLQLRWVQDGNGE